MTHFDSYLLRNSNGYLWLAYVLKQSAKVLFLCVVSCSVRYCKHLSVG